MAELFVQAYNAREYKSISDRFNAQMSAAARPEQIKQFLDSLHNDAGKLVKLGQPEFIASAAANFPAEFEKARFTLQLAVDAEGKIAGLRVIPQQPPMARNTSRNRTALGLPFKGEWLVFWGGDTPEVNYHQNAPNQRFAFDLVKVGDDGRTHRGDGSRNEDYFAFGQELVAPADGVVTYVVDGIHDNKPGEMNRMFVPGNIVIIKHADDEYSLLAHFKQNSIRVKAGDKVARGQVLGLSGNSGNSSEPHLHFQVQNSPFFRDESAVKVFFEKVTVKRDGKSEARSNYSPVKGDIISQE